MDLDLTPPGLHKNKHKIQWEGERENGKEEQRKEILHNGIQDRGGSAGRKEREANQPSR